MRTNTIRSVISIIIVALVVSLWMFRCTDAVHIDSTVFGTCSRPNLPPNARIRFIPNEKIKFEENESVSILCDENQFPHHEQERQCRHGRWRGPQARCGKAIHSKVISLQIFKCEDSKNVILSQYLNQTDELPFYLPPNSFHLSRINPEIDLSVTDFNCYRWIIKFEKKINIAFLLIDINSDKIFGVNDTPIINVHIMYRICKLQTTKYHLLDDNEIFGFYFFCDLKTTAGNQTSNLLKTDHLIMDVHTSSNRTIGLEAVFAGETIKKLVKKKIVPDCGRLEVVRTGVFEQTELDFVQVICNDSFVDLSGRNKHRYTCDSNGLWQGSWPQCQPKKTCSKAEIIDEIPSSIAVEKIANVYYENETMWYAIDYTWVRYECASEFGVMVGKNDRFCFGGKWNNKAPHCTQVQNGSLLPIIIIILITIIAIFSLIVYLAIKFYTQTINQRLESAKTEIEATALRQQHSQEDYSEIVLDTIYEDCKEIYSVPMYEMPDPSRYECMARNLNESEYLSMHGVASSKPSTNVAANDLQYSNC